jgi:hypothetical protein
MIQRLIKPIKIPLAFLAGLSLLVLAVPPAFAQMAQTPAEKRWSKSKPGAS